MSKLDLRKINHGKAKLLKEKKHVYPTFFQKKAKFLF